MNGRTTAADRVTLRVTRHDTPWPQPLMQPLFLETQWRTGTDSSGTVVLLLLLLLVTHSHYNHSVVEMSA